MIRNQYNDKRERIGYWEVYWDSGNPWYKGNYDNGIQDGYWEFYIENKVYKEAYFI